MSLASWLINQMEKGVDLTPVKGVGLVKSSSAHNAGMSRKQLEDKRRLRELSGGIAEHHCSAPGYTQFMS